MAIMPKNLGKSLAWIFRPRPQDTTASSKVLKVQNAAGTDVATVDIEGDVVANSAALTAGITCTTCAPSTSLTVGGGTAQKKVWSATSAATDIGEIAAATIGTQAFTVSGLAAGDAVFLIASSVSLAAFGEVRALVTGANTVTLYLYNHTGAPIDLAEGTYTFLCFDLT